MLKINNKYKELNSYTRCTFTSDVSRKVGEGTTSPMKFRMKMKMLLLISLSPTKK